LSSCKQRRSKPRSKEVLCTCDDFAWRPLCTTITRETRRTCAGCCRDQTGDGIDPSDVVVDVVCSVNSLSIRDQRPHGFVVVEVQALGAQRILLERLYKLVDLGEGQRISPCTIPLLLVEAARLVEALEGIGPRCLRQGGVWKGSAN
jgi:hypothetical protein